MGSAAVVKRLSVIVYPHSTEIGGSQLNAIEIGAAVRDLGHAVAVYASPGRLLDRVQELALDHIATCEAGFRPAAARVTELAQLAREREVDILHGYEWPPILESFMGAWASGRRTAAVGTVMSMGVAPFIPSSLPLMVGTARLRAVTSATRRGPVELLEPPVDTRSNHPDLDPVHRHTLLPTSGGEARIVVVSRLVPELKLEGILTAVRAVGTIARSRAVRLVIVGHGTSFRAVAEEARRTNEAHCREIVTLVGECPDPRWAYRTADVCLGMGGSALRAMAFGKPLIVQGESGFFETVTPENVDLFLEQGWYGIGSIAPQCAEQRLVGLIEQLLDAAQLRDSLGRFGRDLVAGRFSLRRAAAVQVSFYEAALQQPSSFARRLDDSIRSASGLARYKVHRQAGRLLGRVAVDDFNARPR